MALSPVGLIGIHLAPPNVEQQTFLSNVEQLWDSVLALPASKCLLKVEILSPNEHFASELAQMRLGIPPPCVILRIECESIESFRAFIRDPELQRIIASGRSFGYYHDINAFAADITTYHIDERQPTGVHGVLIFKLPSPSAVDSGTNESDPRAKEFHDKLRPVIHNWLALPVVKPNTAKYFAFESNTAIAEDIKLLHYPEAQSMLVLFMEVQELKTFQEIVEEPATAELVLRQIHEAGLPSFETSVFVADVISKREHNN